MRLLQTLVGYKYRLQGDQRIKTYVGLFFRAKKVVFILPSVNSTVISAARTESDNDSNMPIIVVI